MKKNVAIYARTAGADSKEQLQGQMRCLRDYSKKRIGVEPAEFFDESIAGMTADRPGLQELFEHCVANEGTLVLVASPDRLARSMILFEILDRFSNTGADVHYVKT